MKHVNWESLGNKSHKLRKPSRLHQSVKLSSFLDFMREVRFRVHLCKNSYFSWLVRWSRSEIKEAGTCQRLPKMVAEVGGGRRTTTGFWENLSLFLDERRRRLLSANGIQRESEREARGCNMKPEGVPGIKAAILLLSAGAAPVEKLTLLSQS